MLDSPLLGSMSSGCLVSCSLVLNNVATNSMVAIWLLDNSSHYHIKPSEGDIMLRLHMLN
jgi:hypothetical protein